MFEQPDPPHTPLRHASHRGFCGCWLGEGQAIMCRCGAAYTRRILFLSVWHCYDCGGRVHLLGTPDVLQFHQGE